MAATSRAAPFAVFASSMLLQLAVVLAVYPETKGIALEAMQEDLRAPSG